MSNTLKTITDKFIGIIWIEEKSLNDMPDNIYIMDYLLDGLLINNLNNGSTSSVNKHLFHTTNYGNNFFIAKLSPHSQKLKDDIEEILTTQKNLINNNTKPSILVMTKDSQQLNYLKKSHQFHFEFTKE